MTPSMKNENKCPDGYLPASQVKTVCAECANYRRMMFAFDEPSYCAKAEVLYVNPQSGERLRVSAQQKNNGDCSDFKAIPPREAIPPAPEQKPGLLQRLRTAWEAITQ